MGVSRNVNGSFYFDTLSGIDSMPVNTDMSTENDDDDNDEDDHRPLAPNVFASG